MSTVSLLVALLAAACSGEEHAPGPSLGAPGERRAPPVPVETMREAVMRTLALRPGMHVAEIGLGRGWFVFRAAQAVGTTGAVYATDIDPRAVTDLEHELSHIDPAAAHVDARLCHGARDTALDDLPAGSLDVVLMIDSLCFDGTSAPRDADVAYLRRFVRLLAPGGRLVHHMDCSCGTTPDDVSALFHDAGFDAHVETVPVPPAPALPYCRGDDARARQTWVGVFRRP